MENIYWVIFWAIVGIALIIAEIFTLGFVLFWFGLGALVAAFVSFLGFGFLMQFLVFALVSTILTVMSRTIFVNYFFQGESDNIKTGIDALPGKIGTVTSASKGALNEGAVKVYGSVWTAFPEDDTPLTEGEKVEVVRVQGASIYVRKVQEKKELPEWRENL